MYRNLSLRSANARNRRDTARNELSTIGYPDGTHEAFDYDENGDLWHHTKRDGSVVAYAYDLDSRLTTTTYPAATASIAATANVTQTYYANGLPYQMTDGLGTTTRTYDAADRPYQLVNPNQTLTYAYDDAGRLTNKNVTGAFAFSYQYDPGGRLTTEGTPQGNVTYAYDDANRLTRLTKGSGMLTDYAYAPDGQTAEVYWHWSWSSAVMGDARYRYDPAGRLVEHWDPTDGSDTTYGYDGAGQLQSESSSGYSWYGQGSYLLSYDYDHNGNRLHKSLTNANGTYTDAYSYQPNYYNGNLHTDELLSVQGGVTGSRAFTYDQDGDLRSINANGYLLFLTPDYEDRYTRFDFDTGPGRGSAYATEAYNGLGARFARRSADGQQHGLALDGVSPGDALLYDSSGGMIFTPGIGQTSGGVGGPSLYTNVDALGSVHDTETNGSGGPPDVRRYEAFGGPVVSQGVRPPAAGLRGRGGLPDGLRHRPDAARQPLLRPLRRQVHQPRPQRRRRQLVRLLQQQSSVERGPRGS